MFFFIPAVIEINVENCSDFHDWNPWKAPYEELRF